MKKNLSFPILALLLALLLFSFVLFYAQPGLAQTAEELKSL